MKTTINQLRALLKDVIIWQNLFYQYKEEERKQTKAIQEKFHLKRIIAQYPYIKGGEWKSFVALHGLLVVLLLGVFLFAFDYVITSLVLVMVIMTLSNLAFIFFFKPYKVEDWYLVGAVYYGVLIGILSGVTLALASIAFFMEGPSLLLETSVLWLIISALTYVFGGIFPLIYNYLEKTGLKHPELLKELAAIEQEKKKALAGLKDQLQEINQKLEQATQKVESYDVVPAQFKTQRALEFILHYLETGKSETLEDAVERFDFASKDALRTMRILKLT